MSTTVPALPPAPSRNDQPDAFITAADAWVAALPAFGVAINAVGQESEAAAAAAEASELAADASRTAAAVSATTAAQYAGAAEWVSGSYSTGAVVWSPSTGFVYRRKAPGGSSPTDPANDPTNWYLAVIPGLLYRPETTASFTAEVNVEHAMRYAGAQEADMPAPGTLSSTGGEKLNIVVENGRADNYLTLNGAKVNGEVQDNDKLYLDDPFAHIECRWTGPTYGWSI